jgi:hypothetical protein
MLDVHG